MVVTLSKLEELRDLLDASHNNNSEQLKNAIFKLENARATRQGILDRRLTELSSRDGSASNFQAQALWVNSVEIEIKKIDKTIEDLQIELEKSRNLAQKSFTRLQGIQKTCVSMTLEMQKLNQKSEDQALEALGKPNIS